MYIQKMNHKAFCYECGMNSVLTLAEYVVSPGYIADSALCGFCAKKAVSQGISDEQDIRFDLTMHENDLKTVGLKDSAGGMLE